MRLATATAGFKHTRVFVVAAPPHVRRALWPPFRRLFPRFLPAEWRQIEKGPHTPESLDPPSGRELGAIDLATVAQEGAQAKRRPFPRGPTETPVEIRAGG